DLDPDARDQHGLPAARITQWHHPRDEKVCKEMQKMGLAVLGEMGADDVHVRVGIGETVILQGGTCRFGNDAKDSVTSPDGLVHGFKNLYITDGSTIPSSLTCPVTLTIVANALRIADGIKKSAGVKDGAGGGGKSLPVVQGTKAG